MIGKNKKVTFIRIPKNASTSLYNFFGPTNTIRDNVIPSDKEIHKNFFASSHCRISDSVEHLGDEILSLPTLSVVRNPYDRMVSMYFFAQKLNDSYKDILSKVYGHTADNFLNFCRLFQKMSEDERFFSSWSQKSFIQIENETIGDVIRFENLDEDFNKFLIKNDLLGFFEQHGKSLKKENQTSHKMYKNYYCFESKNIVEKLWLKDIQYFKYSF